ncbi:MAG TPA: hypothetical protein VFR62_09625, partial [Gemmatimonadales bacterium]|nr:hypothetical protein [Gemmatimonadales bacterium]
VSGEAFAATLTDASVPVEVVTEPGTEHGHLNRPGEPAASVTVDRVIDWLPTLGGAVAAQPRTETGALGLDTAAKRPTRPTEELTTLRITEGITP